MIKYKGFTKIKIVLFAFLLFGFSKISSQEKITDTQKYETVCKVWGFLKYYHPAIAEGRVDWDNELLNIFPKIESAKTQVELSNILLDWIKGFGKVKACNDCSLDPTKDYFLKNFDLNWITDSELVDTKLSLELQHIEKNRSTGKKQYVIANKKVGNILVKNERTNYKDVWSNKHLRLLSLFRYWNVIEYFYPYKYLMDDSWDLSLKKLIPLFLNSDTKESYELTLLKSIVQLNDSHARITPPILQDYFGSFWIPVRLKIIDDKAIVIGYFNEDLAKKDGLSVGDVILEYDGRNIKDLLEQFSHLVPASNSKSKLRDLTYYAFRGKSDQVQIKVDSGGEIKDQMIKRYKFEDLKFSNPFKENWYIKDSVGVVNISKVNIKQVPKMMEELSNTKGLIIDLRQYPKGTLYSLFKYISSERKPLYSKIIPDLSYPGYFYWVKGQEYGNSKELIYDKRVVILIDEFTQSQGEYMAMGLEQGDNVTLIGSQTAGSDGNVSKINLPSGVSASFSGIGWYYPSKKETQRIGIVPDIIVNPTVKDLMEGRDLVLEKAFETILGSEN